jgi:hypothetical protein
MDATRACKDGSDCLALTLRANRAALRKKYTRGRTRGFATVSIRVGNFCAVHH